jgi:cytochrome o ubiquinol oxidase subunit 2
VGRLFHARLWRGPLIALEETPMNHASSMASRRRRRIPPLLVGLAASLLSGCSGAILDPAGRIGADEKRLLIATTALMLTVVVPVIVMTLFFAWKYRASNERAAYTPEWSHSTRIELVIWTVPFIIVALLAVLTWKSSHDLDPYKPIESSAKPITIEVVALDWKWLFIYPEQHIATVNEIAFPVGVPVNFKVTSDSVMNSFFIPRLGSQVYAMAGMQTQLHLIADRPGVYEGASANFSGDGFSDMKFTARATSAAQFDAWVKQVRQSSANLDAPRYAELAKPSEKQAVAYFAQVEPMLYAGIVDRTVAPDGTRLAQNLCTPPTLVAQRSE